MSKAKKAYNKRRQRQLIRVVHLATSEECFDIHSRAWWTTRFNTYDICSYPLKDKTFWYFVFKKEEVPDHVIRHQRCEFELVPCGG